MKRTLFCIALVFMVLACRTPTAHGLTYGQSFYESNIAYIGAGNYNDPLWQVIGEIEDSLDGTSGVSSIIYTPGTEPSTPSEGMLYYDSGGNNLKLYTGAAFVDIDVSGASSLGTAYTIGSKITAGTLEVEIEVADSANNPALRLDFDDATSNTLDVFIIDNAGDDGDAVSIQINGTAGDDIRGSGDVWSIGQDGAAILVAIDVVGNITLENDEIIKNDNNGEIEFGNGTEDTAFSWSTDSLDLSSDTGVAEIDFGALDSLVGINAVAFDVAVANTITLAGTGAGDDLTISQAGSAQDASLILQSSGTGADALSLISSVADISLVSADNITRTAADNITDVTTDGGYTLTIGGGTNGKYISTVADTYSLISVDALTIQNTEAAKNITINSVLGSIYIEGEEDIADAVLITADGGTTTSLKIHNDTGTSVTEGAGSIEILSDAGGVEIHSSANLAKAIQIVADGGVTESIYVQADQGTAASAATESDAAIQLVADVGGIGLRSGLSAANSIRLEADGGVAEGIILHSNQGTSVTEGTNAVQLLADAGGIGIESNANLAKAISLVSDGGTTSSIYVQADTGTAASATTESDASIQLVSDVGGIGLLSGLAAVDAIRIEATAAAAQITVHNKLGTTAAAATEIDASIQLYSEVGGIGLTSKLNAADAIRLESNGGTSETINIHSNQGTGVASINLLSDDGGITVDSGANDAITLTAGTGGVVFTSGQTRTVHPTVVLDGTVPPSQTAVGTSAQSQIPVYSFDANPNATGDDYVFLYWRVPAGYVVDSADLFFTFSYSTTETDGDDVNFDCTVLAITPGTGAAGGTAFDAAGTAVAALDVDLVNGAGDEGKVMEGTFDIEVTALAVGDEVRIAFWVDEDQCDLAASGTVDIHEWTITYETTE